MCPARTCGPLVYPCRGAAIGRSLLLVFKVLLLAKRLVFRGVQETVLFKLLNPCEVGLFKSRFHHAAHDSDSSSACSKTVFVAFSCLSGG